MSPTPSSLQHPSWKYLRAKIQLTCPQTLSSHHPFGVALALGHPGTSCHLWSSPCLASGRAGFLCFYSTMYKNHVPPAMCQACAGPCERAAHPVRYHVRSYEEQEGARMTSADSMKQALFDLCSLATCPQMVSETLAFNI